VTQPAGSGDVPSGVAAEGFTYTATVPGLYTFQATAGNALGVDLIVGDFVLKITDASDPTNRICDADDDSTETGPLYVGLETAAATDCAVMVTIMAADTAKYPDPSKINFSVVYFYLFKMLLGLLYLNSIFFSGFACSMCVIENK